MLIMNDFDVMGESLEEFQVHINESIDIIFDSVV